jgi:hypothetical protein
MDKNKTRENLTESVETRCKPSEKLTWIERAEQQGLYLSEWVRKVLNRAK